MTNGASSRDSAHRWSTIALLALILLIFAALFFDVLTGKTLYLYTDIGFDTVSQYWPLLTYLTRTIETGTFSFWTFQIGVGTDLLGLTDYLFDPFNLLYLVAGSEHVAIALPYVFLVKLLIAGVLFQRFLRLFDVDEVSALVAALFYVFSGYMILRGQHYHYATRMVYMAVLLYGFELWLQRRRIVPFVTATALLCAVGIVPAFQTALLFVVYAPLRMLRVTRGDVAATRLRLAALAGLAVIGAGMAAWSLLPAAYVLSASPRLEMLGGTGEQPLVNDLVFFRTAAARLFANDLLGNGSGYRGWWQYHGAPQLYVGLPALLLLPQYVASLPRRQRLTVAALIALTLSFFVFPPLNRIFSGHATYYRWTCIVIPVQLLATAAALTLVRRGRLRRGLLGATVLVLGATLVLVHDSSGILGRGLPTVWLCGMLALLLVAYAALLLWMSSNTQLATALFLGLVVIELTAVSYPTVNRAGQVPGRALAARVLYNDRSADAVRVLRARDPDFYRIGKSRCSVLGCNDPLMQDYAGHGGYVSLHTASYLRFLREFGVYSGPGKILQPINEAPIVSALLSTRYFICNTRRCPQRPELEPLPGFAGRPRVFRDRAALPFAFAYDRHVTEATLRNASTAVRRGRVWNTAIVAQPLAGVARGSATGVGPDLSARLRRRALAIEHFAPDDIRGRIRVPTTSVLFASIPYHEGWSILIDGVRAEPLRVHYGFLGAVVPAGDHEIAFRFVPRRLRLGLVLAGFALLALVVVAGRTMAPAAPR